MDSNVEQIVAFGVAFLVISLVACTVFVIIRDMFFSTPGTVAQRLGTGRPSSIPQLTGPPVSVDGGFSQRVENWFGRLIYETGLSLTGEVALLLEVMVGLIIGGGLFLWFEDLLLAIAGFVAGMVLVVLFFMYWRLRRRSRLRDQLPDILEHIARAVRAGRTVDEAVQMVGESAPAPLGIEFRRCGRQLSMGLSVEAAMRAMSKRVPLPEMRIMSSTFIVQRRAGGNLPTTLERLAKVIRDRIAYFRQYRAATAGARMSAMLIAIAGPAVTLYLLTREQDYFMRFLESPQGMFFLAAAIGLYFSGLIWVMYILRTDY